MSEDLICSQVDSAIQVPRAPQQNPNTHQLGPNWYAAQTCARHEKTIAERFNERSLEFYLPLHEAVHQWKNKRANVALPLFPGYIFVFIDLKDRIQVLQTPGVVRLVGFGSRPVPIPAEEIRILRHGLSERRVEPHAYLAIGKMVRFRGGPFARLEGVLLRRKNNLRVVVSIHTIARSFVVEVEASELELIGSAEPRTAIRA